MSEAFRKSEFIKMLEQKEIDKLKSWCSKFFTADNKAIDIWDFNAEVDKSLTYQENLTILREKIRNFLNIYNEEQIKKVEIQAKLEFEKVLEKIQNDKTTNLIEETYYIPKQYAKMVANGFAKGFILFGNCLPINTKVLTPNGYKNIQDVKEIISYNLKKEKFENEKCRVVFKGKQKVIKINTGEGIIKCSIEHLWYIMRNKKIKIVKAKNIKTTDFLIKPKDLNKVFPNKY